MSAIPNLKMNSGYEIPLIGFGTWQSKPGEVAEAVKKAISAGYRHIDCAFEYKNEKEIGAAIRHAIKQAWVKREDLFITSKLWLTCFRKDVVKHALKKSLEDLGVTYLDLYLLHSPVSLMDSEPGNLTNIVPNDDDGKAILSNVHYLEPWGVMEECVNEGLIRSIGVSNFNSVQIQDVIDHGKIKPAMNQIECHPYLTQCELIAFCERRGVRITAYSPLGGNAISKYRNAGDPEVLKEPELARLAAKHKKTPAQIALRFNLQRNVCTIPKSVTPSRIEENINILDFELLEEDMAAILALDRNWRSCKELFGLKHPQYPFNARF